jgi:uncharacterized protein (TIGR01777 family)
MPYALRMRIVIAGGSGFLGSALAAHLAADNHQIVILTRQPRSADPSRPRTSYKQWSPDGHSGSWANALDNADAVVNLAGESIAAKRWSTAQKQRIRDSRLLATRSLTAAVREVSTPPRVFISGSAVGYYGDRGDETLTEASAPGTDFLAGVCKDWEAAANAIGAGTRVVLIRTGIVLDRKGGALPKMLPPFYLFAGGPIGSGRQYMPWIHRDDWVRLVAWSATSDSPRGALNVTGPKPITNKEFSTALGQALRRPSVMPAPPFALRIALGEMADALLLSSQRALPVRATDLGFTFRFSNIDDALADIFTTR